MYTQIVCLLEFNNYLQTERHPSNMKMIKYHKYLISNEMVKKHPNLQRKPFLCNHISFHVPL